MLWLNYVVIVSLVVSVTAKYIPPVIFWVPSFFGLAFPFIFLLNLLFIFYWLIQFKNTFVFGLIALCIALPTAFRYLQFSFEPRAGKTATFTVTSYNAMLFDLYNWGWDRFTRPKIFGSLQDLNSDIICFQEFYTSEQAGDYNNTDTVREKLGLPYFHVEYTATLRDLDHWGIATFSKYPIVNKGKIPFNTASNNLCIYSDVVIDRDTVRIYNLHLQSISFSRADNKFIQDVTSDQGADHELEHGKNIMRRLKKAFIKRTQQVKIITAHMKTCRHRIILCGDFNDTAASYAYEELSKDLNDAFIEKGSGFGRTYAGKWPQFRIDYILYDKRLTCAKYKRSGETFTDHYPITSWFNK
jgi:endonuclease/exonuclease/phosphatase family metal-dependent hydrolase